jgi:hypothetical protein
VPVKRGLAEVRRAALLGLIAELNDAAVVFQRGWPSKLAERGNEALRSLLDRLAHQDAAGVAGLASVVTALRGEGSALSSVLGSARGRRSGPELAR